jgi:GNAT superfamily N-acetyltransferase
MCINALKEINKVLNLYEVMVCFSFISKIEFISMTNYHLALLPLTTRNWVDFENLFGERGACGGCWCMWFRLKHSEFEKQKGERNKKAMRSIVDSGKIPGILAYDGKIPVGWCSVAPREDFGLLERSRILKPIDDQPVWSIVCFFIHKEYRNKNVSLELIKAAVEYVKKQGGKIVEGYPVEPKKERMPEVFAYYGLASAFRKAGFSECERRSETRPIMRYYIK